LLRQGQAELRIDRGKTIAKDGFPHMDGDFMPRTSKHSYYVLPSTRLDPGTPHRPGSGPPAESGQGQIMEQLPALVWITDAELRFTSVHGAGLLHLAMPGEVAGMRLGKCFANDPAVLAAHETALSGQAMTFEFSRNERVFFGQAEPLFDAQGSLAGTVAVVLDISDRLGEEEARRQQARRDFEAHKARSLSTLAGGVAHNLNDLLTAIMGYTAVALLKLPTHSPARAIFLEVEDAAQEAVELANELLIFAREPLMQGEAIDINQLIENMREATRSEIPGHVLVNLDLAGSLPAVNGTATQLGRLVSSLMYNAAEAIGAEEGKITVKTQPVQVDAAFLAQHFPGEELPEGSYILLQVSDTGCGMGEEVRQRAFEPFFSTKVHGRGLGLAVSQGIAHGHEGAIAATSCLGEGTTISVLLPCLRSKQKVTV
jgi:signal transduction histidine kinase